MAIQFNDANFSELVINSTQLSVVDFWAEWCGPCRAIAPTIEELSIQFAGKVNIGKLDVDNNPKVPSEFGITSIPAILFFKNGQVVDKQIGAVPKSVLEKKINSHL